MEAAEFTNSKEYKEINDLIADSDVIFLTVSDGQIKSVWNQLKSQHIKNKIICHCSGAMSSDVFSDITDMNCYGYSIHPLFAVSNKYDSYKELSNSYFTIEGDTKYLDRMISLFENLGNKVITIDKKDKVKYHAAAAVCSNLVVGLINMSENLLKECGFDEKSAHEAITPIVMGKIKHIKNDGTVNALTGPIQRNDIGTIKKHLECLNDDEKRTYKAVSLEVLKVAENRDKNIDYSEMEEILK